MKIIKQGKNPEQIKLEKEKHIKEITCPNCGYISCITYTLGLLKEKEVHVCSNCDCEWIYD